MVGKQAVRHLVMPAPLLGWGMFRPMDKHKGNFGLAGRSVQQSHLIRASLSLPGYKVPIFVGDHCSLQRCRVGPSDRGSFGIPKQQARPLSISVVRTCRVGPVRSAFAGLDSSTNSAVSILPRFIHVLSWMSWTLCPSIGQDVGLSVLSPPR